MGIICFKFWITKAALILLGFDTLELFVFRKQSLFQYTSKLGSVYSNRTVSRFLTYCVLVYFLQIFLVVVIWCYASKWENNNFYLRDVLRNLPDNVIDDILMRLPLRNVVRTSILSRNGDIIGIDFRNRNLIKHFGKQQRTWCDLQLDLLKLSITSWQFM